MRPREQAEAALARLRACWRSSVWSPKRPRPGSCTWRGGDRGLISSGFTTGWCGRADPEHRRSVTFLARWPSGKAMQHARDRIREMTGRERLLLPAEVIVTELNLSCAAGPDTSATETPPALRPGRELRPLAGSGWSLQTAQPLATAMAGACRPSSPQTTWA